MRYNILAQNCPGTFFLRTSFPRMNCAAWIVQHDVLHMTEISWGSTSNKILYWVKVNISRYFQKFPGNCCLRTGKLVVWLQQAATYLNPFTTRTLLGPTPIVPGILIGSLLGGKGHFWLAAFGRTSSEKINGAKSNVKYISKNQTSRKTSDTKDE